MDSVLDDLDQASKQKYKASGSKFVIFAINRPWLTVGKYVSDSFSSFCLLTLNKGTIHSEPQIQSYFQLLFFSPLSNSGISKTNGGSTLSGSKTAKHRSVTYGKTITRTLEHTPTLQFGTRKRHQSIVKHMQNRWLVLLELIVSRRSFQSLSLPLQI